MSTLKVANLQHPDATGASLQIDSTGAIIANNSMNVVGNLVTTGMIVPAYSFMRNKIINGHMLIDQRNAGASITPTNTQYTVDRWWTWLSQASKLTVQQNAAAVTPPAGFQTYLGVTSSSAYTVLSADYFALVQPVEAINFYDLNWGTVNARPVTLSFWVRSSLTGTFGGAVANSAQNRSYPFSYTISSANTWEYKTVTIPGDTTGTWLGATNGIGVRVQFGLGVGTSNSNTAGSWYGANYISATGATSVVGTNAATFYLTGVQLESGSVATPFEHRHYGQELALCQRYLPIIATDGGTNAYVCTGMAYSATAAYYTLTFPVPTRIPPTGITVSAASHFSGMIVSTAVSAATGVSFQGSCTTSALIALTGMSGHTTGSATLLYLNNAASKIYFTGCEL